MDTLSREAWRARAAVHQARVDAWVGPHLARRRRGERHPVEDFLFDYYRLRPGALRRWHPGYPMVLTDAPEYAAVTGYRAAPEAGRDAVVADPARLARLAPLVASTRTLLRATLDRSPAFGCLGLHEWAMVYRLAPDRVRHPDRPLRLGATGTDRVVETHRLSCTHFDAYRFFTEAARPRNRWGPGPDDRARFEQPGCLHAGMDLYKHAYRLLPLVGSDLVADCFALAREIRVLDMRASPYDLRDLGYEPVRIETPEGKQEYAAAQRRFAERAAPVRARLLAECERLLAAGPAATGRRASTGPDRLGSGAAR